jgi:hypothetical protein
MTVKKFFLYFAALITSSLLSSSTIFAQVNINELDGRRAEANGTKHNILHPAVPLLTIAPDSRSSSMGDAGVASEPDVFSQHWNSAKYALIPKQWGVAISYIPWLRKLTNEINLAYLVGYYRIDKMQSVSASLRYFSMGQMTFTDDLGNKLTTHNPNEFAIDIAYSRLFIENFGGAVAFRVIRSDLTGGFSQQNSTGSSSAGMSYAADIALYYQNKIKMAMPAQYAVGLTITNIGSKLSYNDVYKNFIPITLRLGGRFSLDIDQYNRVSTVLDAAKLLIPTPPQYDRNGNIIKGYSPNVAVVSGMIQSFYDAPGGAAEEFKEIYWGIGFEYSYAKQFAIRTGYFFEHEDKGGRQYFTLGAGVTYNIFGLDVSYIIPSAGFNSPLANTLRFSLSVNLDQQKGNKKKRKA